MTGTTGVPAAGPLLHICLNALNPALGTRGLFTPLASSLSPGCITDELVALSQRSPQQEPNTRKVARLLLLWLKSLPPLLPEAVQGMLRRSLGLSNSTREVVGSMKHALLLVESGSYATLATLCLFLQQYVARGSGGHPHRAASELEAVALAFAPVLFGAARSAREADDARAAVALLVGHGATVFAGHAVAAAAAKTAGAGAGAGAAQAGAARSSS
ncbi:hypothetical protein FOA52_001689 [Chlamydomonas sp. UWO 241]|nr:hypothetical protein FOA52_001689 [Chlamydomonas sp. UWO 241]